MDLAQLTRGQTTVTVPETAEVWDLTSEEAGKAIKTLGADTAREILACLYEQPQTASELANATENSLQNVNYHLQNLVEAGLIEVGDTRYSQKGTEMKIYTPTTNAVLLLSQESVASRIKQMLARLVTGIGALAIGAIVFRTLVVGGLITVPGVDVEPEPRAEDTDDAGTLSTEAEPQERSTGELVDVIQPLDHLPFLLDPGVVFFLGGLTVLLVVLGVQALWTRR